MSNYQTVKQVIKQLLGQENTIAIPRLFIKMFSGDTTAALFLSQAVFWSDKSSRRDGYFYKSYKEWDEHTGLSQYQVKRSCDKCNKLLENMIETKLIKANGAPTLHYKVDMDAVISLIIKFIDNPEYLQTNINILDNPLTEITTDIKDDDVKETDLSIMLKAYETQLGKLPVQGTLIEFEKLIDKWDARLAVLVDNHPDKNISAGVAFSEALKISVEQDAKNPYTYAKSIYENWMKTGYKSPKPGSKPRQKRPQQEPRKKAAPLTEAEKRKLQGLPQ